MYSSTFDVGDLLLASNSRIFLLGQLQAGLVGHHQPAAEGLVVAAVAVHRHADVHLAFVQLLGRLGQGRFDGAKHDVALDALFARDGFHQHQHFAIHAHFSPVLPISHQSASGLSHKPKNHRARQGAPLEIHNRCQPRLRSSSSVKPSACTGAGARFADLLARLGRRARRSRRSASRRLAALQRAAKLLAVGGHLAGAAHPWRLQRDVDHLADETLEILFACAAAGRYRARTPRAACIRSPSTSSANCSWRVTFSQSSTLTNCSDAVAPAARADRS
jgi:hypothetical protein